MLTALRRLAGTWFAKLLFLLLILSFAIWGIEDVVRNFGRDDAVARVGDMRIDLPEAQNAARRQLQTLQRQLGASFEPTPEVRRAVAQQAVEALITQRSLLAEASQLGAVAPPAAVRDYIFAIPSFQGGDGRFSRVILNSFLRQNDLSEAEFLAMVTNDLVRQQLSGAVRAGAAGPDAMTTPLLAWQQERRIAELVELPFFAAAEPEAPTEEQLRRFHENNADRFSAPEYRDATVAVLNVETLAGQVDVPAAQIAEAYNQRRAQFDTPERREIEQVLIGDEAKAKTIQEAWAGGADFAAITASAAEAGGQALPLGLVDRSSLPFPALEQAAFGGAEGSVSAPVESPFGWHVLKVVRIEPGHTRSLEEVTPELKRELAREKASDLAYEQANRIEDALAGGATLAEVSRQFNLTAATIRTDAAGQAPDGSAVELPIPATERAATLRSIFATAPGTAPRMSDAVGGAFSAIEVTGVTPPALKPFETVAEDVRRAWINDARRRAQETAAAGLLAATRTGKSLAEAAREAGLQPVPRGPFLRMPAPQGAPGQVPRELLGPLFAAPVGETTMAETAGGFVVAQLTQVVPFDPASDPLGLGRVRTEIEQTMQDDLEAQYAAALRARARPRINPEAMRQVVGE